MCPSRSSVSRTWWPKQSCRVFIRACLPRTGNSARSFRCKVSFHFHLNCFRGIVAENVNPRPVIFAFPNQFRPGDGDRVWRLACRLVAFCHARSVSDEPDTGKRGNCGGPPLSSAPRLRGCGPKTTTTPYPCVPCVKTPGRRPSLRQAQAIIPKLTTQPSPFLCGSCSIAVILRAILTAIGHILRISHVDSLPP